MEERVSADGTVLTALGEEEIGRVLDELAAASVDAVAVCLLFSFVTPDHELKLGQALKEHLPDLAVSLSHDVLPVHREFERTSTTVINALAKPLMGRYLERISRTLERRGSGDSLFVMQSSGGVMGWQEAMERPVYTLYSGPSGGVVCAAELGRLVGFQNVISFDMGGTSSDVSAVTGDDPDRVTYFEVARYPVQIPALDIVSVGAGGGSIAWTPRAAHFRSGRTRPVRRRDRRAMPAAAASDRYRRGSRLGWYNPESPGRPAADRCGARASRNRQARPGARLGRPRSGVGCSAGSECEHGARRPRGVCRAGARSARLCARGDGRCRRRARIRGCRGAWHRIDSGRPVPRRGSAHGMLLAEFRRDAAYAVHRLVAELEVEDLELRLRALSEDLAAQARGLEPRDLRLFATADLPTAARHSTCRSLSPSRKALLGRALRRLRGSPQAPVWASIPGAEIEIVNLRASITTRFRSAAWRRARWSRPASTARSVIGVPRWAGARPRLLDAMRSKPWMRPWVR